MKTILLISTFSLILFTACTQHSDSPVFAYVVPTVSTQMMDRFAVDSNTGLLTSTPATAYSSNTQTYRQVTFATVNGVQYAYITDQVNAVVYQCTINTNSSFHTCLPLLAPSDWEPYAIAFAIVNNVQYAYVTDVGGGNIYQCSLNPDGSFSSCPTATSETFPAPYGIAFATVNNTQYAYLADAGLGGVDNYGHVYQCQLNSDGTFVVPCVVTTNSTPQWIPYAIAFTSVAGTQYAYVADNGTGASPGDGNLYLCPLNPTNGLFTQCNPTPSSSAPPWDPYFIAFATLKGQQYAYVADAQGSGRGGMYRCIVTNNGAGALSNCQLTPTSPPSTWGPVGIAF